MSFDSFRSHFIFHSQKTKCVAVFSHFSNSHRNNERSNLNLKLWPNKQSAAFSLYPNCTGWSVEATHLSAFDVQCSRDYKQILLFSPFIQDVYVATRISGLKSTHKHISCIRPIFLRPKFSNSCIKWKWLKKDRLFELIETLFLCFGIFAMNLTNTNKIFQQFSLKIFQQLSLKINSLIENAIQKRHLFTCKTPCASENISHGRKKANNIRENGIKFDVANPLKQLTSTIFGRTVVQFSW